MRANFLSVFSVFVALSSICSLAADNTNVLVATDWSAPVDYSDHAVRGRLLIVEGNEPAYGGPQNERHVSMFVELQHVTGACCPSVKLYFDVMGLNCELAESNGKPVPMEEPMSWGGRGPLRPIWVILPYNATSRLFINSGGRSPLHIHQNGEPWRRWSLKPDDTKAYVLSATMDIRIPTNSVLTVSPPGNAPHDYAEWQGKLVFPKVRFVITKP